MDKATLLAMLLSNREIFERTLANVDEHYILHPHPEDQQSTKDLLAHVAAWQYRQNEWFKTLLRGEIPEHPDWKNIHQINHETAQRDKEQPLDKVQHDFKRSFQEFISIVSSIPPEKLNQVSQYNWSRWKEDEPEPLWHSIVRGPGYVHLQSHLYDLLIRVPESECYQPDPEIIPWFSGTYQSNHPSNPPALTIYVQDGQLIARTDKGDRVGIAATETQYAFKDLGLIIFSPYPDGTVPCLEWRTITFHRVKE